MLKPAPWNRPLDPSDFQVPHKEEAGFGRRRIIKRMHFRSFSLLFRKEVSPFSTRKKPLKRHETSWNIMKRHETSWNVMKHHETSWNSMKHHETLISRYISHFFHWFRVSMVSRVSKHLQVGKIWDLWSWCHRWKSRSVIWWWFT